MKRLLLPSKAFLRSAKRLTEKNPSASEDIRVTLELLSTFPAIRGFTEIHVGRAVREPETDDGRVVAGKVEAVAAVVHAIPG